MHDHARRAARGRRLRLTAALVCGLSCLLLQTGGSSVLAQAAPPARTEAGRRDAREVESYLQGLERLRSGCGNAAWTLWYSNSYQRWRERKTPALAMNYNAAFFQTLVPAPASLPDTLRPRLDDAAGRANGALRESAGAFKELADYINAKDYEGDKFKKGDALNARLVELGRACHALHATLSGLYVEMAEGLIETGRARAARPDAVATMVADWRRARELSVELTKGPAAQMTRVEALVGELSTLSDERRRGTFAADLQGGGGSLERFYDKVLNESVAVPMRKLLREAKADRKALAEASADRPRNAFWSVRGEIDHQMPDAILSFIRGGR